MDPPFDAGRQVADGAVATPPPASRAGHVVFAIFAIPAAALMLAGLLGPSFGAQDDAVAAFFGFGVGLLVAGGLAVAAVYGLTSRSWTAARDSAAARVLSEGFQSFLHPAQAPRPRAGEGMHAPGFAWARSPGTSIATRPRPSPAGSPMIWASTDGAWARRSVRLGWGWDTSAWLGPRRSI